jgi:hypothetical protein
MSRGTRFGRSPRFLRAQRDFWRIDRKSAGEPSGAFSVPRVNWPVFINLYTIYSLFPGLTLLPAAASLAYARADYEVVV